jgi:hypothetical protein
MKRWRHCNWNRSETIDFSGNIRMKSCLPASDGGGGNVKIRSRSFRCSGGAFIQPTPTFEFFSVRSFQKVERSVNNFIRKMLLFKWPRSAMRAAQKWGNRSRQNHRRHPVIKRQLTESKNSSPHLPVCHVNNRLPADDKFAQSDDTLN